MYLSTNIKKDIANTDNNNRNKNYRRICYPRVKSKVVVIVEGHSVIATPPIYHDDRGYHGPLRSILKKSDMFASYTDTNVHTYVTSEPAHMTNDSGDIKHNSYDHPAVIHISKYMLNSIVLRKNNNL